MRFTGDYPPEMIATVPSSCGMSPSAILSDVIDFHSVVPVMVLLFSNDGNLVIHNIVVILWDL